jgi:hypothetical protein
VSSRRQRVRLPTRVQRYRLDSNTELLFVRSLSLPPLTLSPISVMAHLHDSSFRSLVRYEEYYLAGGDLFFMVFATSSQPFAVC